MLKAKILGTVEGAPTIIIKRIIRMGYIFSIKTGVSHSANPTATLNKQYYCVLHLRLLRLNCLLLQTEICFHIHSIRYGFDTLPLGYSLDTRLGLIDIHCIITIWTHNSCCSYVILHSRDNHLPTM